MYYVSKRIEVAGAHKLELDYPSKCSNIHGHNWIIIVHCKAEQLDRNGMVIDFAYIKYQVKALLDHKYINEAQCEVTEAPWYDSLVISFEGINPTAENIAKAICDMVGEKCYKVEVWESEGNYACYEK